MVPAAVAALWMYMVVPAYAEPPIPPAIPPRGPDANASRLAPASQPHPTAPTVDVAASVPPPPPPAAAARPFPTLRRAGQGPNSDARPQRESPATGWSVVYATVLVLGLVIGGGYLVRRFLPGVASGSGTGAVTVLARTALGPKQWVCLVRCGRRVLVIGQSGDRLTPLSEVTDGEEVAALLAECEQDRSDSSSATFRRIFRRESREMSEELAEFDAGHDAPAQATLGAVAKLRRELAGLMEKVHGWKQT